MDSCYKFVVNDDMKDYFEEILVWDNPRSFNRVRIIYTEYEHTKEVLSTFK